MRLTVGLPKALEDMNAAIPRGRDVLICSLLYLALSARPDFEFDVSLLSRFMGVASGRHIQVATRILRYIEGIFEFGVQYGNQ